MCFWNSFSCSLFALDDATTFIRSLSRGLDAALAASIWMTGSALVFGGAGADWLGCWLAAAGLIAVVAGVC
jgi:hypothetical protein